MKKLQAIAACLGIIILVLTCQKLDFDVITKVQTTSVTTGVDYIQAKGEIVDLSSDNHGEYGFCYSTGPLPTADDQKVVIESPKKGVFTCQITGLTPNSKYYIRPYCYEGGSSVYGDVVEVKTSIETLKDVDNNTYNAMSICNQVWMQENLKVTHYRNGDEIPNVANDASWSGLSTGALCWYNNEVSNKEVYGALYNYYAIADPRNVCPIGWHVPSEAEWATLIDCLGGDDVAGGAMKEYGLSHWKKPNEGATNSSGFSALPAGYRGNDASFNSLSEEGKWWTATAIDATSSAFRYIYNNYTTVFKENFNKANGLSIRCIKGELLSIPSVTTSAIGNISPNSASSGGNVVSDGGSTVSARGVCWSTSQNPTISLTTKTVDGAGIGEYTSNLSGLNPNTTYYVRAYATNSVGTAYGNEINFTTSQATSIPALTTTEASSVTSSSAVSGGNITFEGSSSITERGVCWSTSSNPTVALSTKTVESVSGTGSFVASITGLAANTKYYVRAYATNGAGTAYGNEISFTTLQLAVAPTLTTTAASSITSSSAVSGGNITSEGSSSITERGVCWSTSSNPTVALSTKTVEAASGTGSFVANISGLAANTTYYVKAYATNSAGTAYGNEISFTTLQEILVPTLTTADATSITSTTAISGGNIVSIGSTPIVERGVCWSTSQNPTVDLITKTVETTSLSGMFICNITGLIANTKYYVRAYATNSMGTGYGNEGSFITLKIDPTITNFPSITKNYGDSPFTLTQPTSDSPGAFSYSSANTSVATISGNTVTIVGVGESIITANQAATTSYNSGTISAKLTVNAVIPTVTTASITNITSTTATSGGDVTSNGGAAIIARGVCWSTTTNPVATGNHTVDGTTTGVFTSSIAGLSAGTTYYVRAYATNSAGTGYGNELTFYSCLAPGITTYDPVSIGNTTAKLYAQVWTNFTATTVVFEYGTTSSYGSTISAYIAKAGEYNYYADVTGLTPNTLYYFRVRAENCGGVTYGSQKTFSTILAVGDNYQGGKIAYIFQPGDPGYVAGQTHGYVVTSNFVGWYPWDIGSEGNYKTTGATATLIGTGSANTNMIVSTWGVGTYAAKICYDLVLNGFSDWYLPSKDELYKLYLNRTVLGIPGDCSAWSSSEVDEYKAWYVDISNLGNSINVSKLTSAYVYAFRTF